MAGGGAQERDGAGGGGGGTVSGDTVSMRMQVQSLALLSGLRTQHHHKLQRSHRCILDLAVV